MQDVFFYNERAPHALVLNSGGALRNAYPPYIPVPLPEDLRNNSKSGYTRSAPLTGSGFVDIYLAHSGGYQELLVNDGSGNFTVRRVLEDPYADSFFEANLYDVVVMDVAGDDTADDIILGYDLMPNLVLRNDGAGNFERVVDAGSITADSERTWELHVLDLNEDGLDDVLSINYEQANTVHINEGGGRFSMVTNTPIT